LLSNIIKAEISKLNRLYKKDEKSIVAYLKKSDFNQFTIKKHKRNKWMSIKAKSEDENYIEIIHSGEYKFLIYSFTFSSARWTKTQINSSDTIGILSTHIKINWESIKKDISYAGLFINQNYLRRSHLFKAYTDKDYDKTIRIVPFRNKLYTSMKYDFYGISKDFKMIRNYIYQHTVKLPNLENKELLAEKLSDFILKEIYNYKDREEMNRYSFYHREGPTNVNIDDFILHNFELDCKYILPYLLERYSFSNEDFILFKNTELYSTFISKVDEISNKDELNKFFKRNTND